MNKNSTFDFERQRELRLVKCNTASEREWTYEGERTRKKFSVSSNRRGVPVTARSVCSYATKVDLKKSNLGGTTVALSSRSTEQFRPSGFFVAYRGVPPLANLSIFQHRTNVMVSFAIPTPCHSERKRRISRKKTSTQTTKRRNALCKTKFLIKYI